MKSKFYCHSHIFKLLIRLNIYQHNMFIMKNHIIILVAQQYKNKSHYDNITTKSHYENMVLATTKSHYDNMVLATTKSHYDNMVLLATTKSHDNMVLATTTRSFLMTTQLHYQ